MFINNLKCWLILALKVVRKVFFYSHRGTWISNHLCVKLITKTRFASLTRLCNYLHTLVLRYPGNTPVLVKEPYSISVIAGGDC